MQNIDVSLKNIISSLPHRSFSRNKKPLEPVTLIILGDKRSIINLFIPAGWYLSDKVNPWTGLKAFLATIFSRGYKTGPIWSAYIEGRKNDLGFERPTQSGNFRRRHHVRLWKTRFKINEGNLWVGTLSYDRSVGFNKNGLMPIHHINPTLAYEEGFLARNLGLKTPRYISLSPPEHGKLGDDDQYIWDGKALIVDLSTAEGQSLSHG